MASEYVVLRSAITDPTGDATSEEAWVEIGRASAATPKQAIQRATDGKPAAERTGTFVAVPVRSWRPTVRSVETREHDQWT